MDHDDALINLVRQRLRRAPVASVASLVPDGAFPSPFFGNIFASRVATIGLNPAGPDVFFRTSSREDASDDECDAAVRWLRSYFRREGVGPWFSHLQRVLEAMGFTGYWDAAQNREGDTVHLDLVQEPTTRKWARLTETEREALLATDLPFLKWTIEAFPLVVVLCDGSTALDRVRGLLAGTEIDRGTIQRSPHIIFGWDVLSASVNDRTVAIAGWSPPLNRPTGLTPQDETALGKRIAETLRARDLSM